MRRWIVVSVILVVAAAATLVLTLSDRTTTGVRDRDLILTGDDRGDTISVGCGNRGTVKVNRLPPNAGRVRCSTVTSIRVLGNGGADAITLARVTPEAFPRLVSVSINGGAGADLLVGSGVTDAITGREGPDRISSSIGDAVYGGTGKDAVDIGVTGDVTIPADTFGAVELVSVIGSDDNDRINATACERPLELQGRDGDDVLIAGSGPTTLGGGDGKDKMIGGPADDRLLGGRDQDTSSGGAGDDQFGDLYGADTARGGTGDDIYELLVPTRDAFIGGRGHDTVRSQVVGRIRVTDHFLAEQDGSRLWFRSVERMDLFVASETTGWIDARRFPGTARLRGEWEDDVLLGGSGRDRIVGGRGDDVLEGGAGRDHLDGSSGRDACDGGLGGDVVVECER